MRTFQAGDVVRAKGPRMTIENVCATVGDRVGVLCTWFEDDGDLRREIFDPMDLEPTLQIGQAVWARSAEQGVVLAQLVAERERQDRQWGGPDHDDDHQAKDWLRFIREHADRATRALKGRDFDEYRKQLVEIAALAVAGIESNDRLGGRR